MSLACVCCGGGEFRQQAILWDRLIDEWQLSPHEVEYVNRQQGLQCTACGANLRSMVLAEALMRCFGYEGLFREFVISPAAKNISVMEINEAGTLSHLLAEMPGHVLQSYPDIDMMNMTHEDGTFDLVVHSDTLEHIRDPLRALAECRRVLKPGGFCVFTVPMVVDRLTVSRLGRPPSFHNCERESGEAYLVHTEYGADAWRQVILAGFDECRIISLAFPAAQALVGVKTARRQPPWP